MKRRGFLWFGFLAIFLAMSPMSAAADDFADYKSAAGTTAEIDLPTIASYATAADFFPDGTADLIDGKYEAEGRLIAATGTSIYMQRTYGSSVWDVVATVPSAMDPSFIHVSPDGDKIALGLGYNQALLIVPTSVLSVQNPPDLTATAAVDQFPQISYYDGDWRDNRYFIVDGGSWPTGCSPPYDENPACNFSSGVGAVDTEDNNPATHVGAPLIQNIGGASSDVEVDGSGNLITGIGWSTEGRTGELKVWADGEWDPVNGSSNDYESNTRYLATNVLSGAYLGQDAEGNLHVGGGDAFSSTPPIASENGYAAIIANGVVGRVAAGGAAVNDGDKSDNSEYKYFAPDTCQDDTATGILADSWGRGLGVMWNPGTCVGGLGSASDYWSAGDTPRLTIYYPGSAPDTDGDGVPDSGDNAYLAANPGQEDADGDGYGNAADADFDNSGAVNLTDYQEFRSVYGSSVVDSIYDINSDGVVNLSDYQSFRNFYGSTSPWY